MANPGGKRLRFLVKRVRTLGVEGDILKSCADENCPVEILSSSPTAAFCCTVSDDFIPDDRGPDGDPQRPITS